MTHDKRILTILLGIVLAIFFAGPSHALTTHFNTTSINVGVGSTFNLDLFADSDDSILGWDIDLLYDNTQVKWIATTLGSDWDSVSSIDGDGFAAAVTILPPSGNDILLASLTFQCLGVGTSNINVGLSPGFGINEGILELGNGLVQNWTATGVTVNQTVPEPGTLLLLGTALSGLCLSAYRRRLKER